MRKLLNKPWVVAVLVLLAVVLVAQSLLDRSPQPVHRDAAVDAAEPEDGSAEEVSGTDVRAGSLVEALARISLPEELPDPFAPRRARATETAPEIREAGPDQTETVKLSAIWEQDGVAFVLLNGRVCQAGDVVGRMTVDSIEGEGIWLTHWKGRDFVRLGQEFTLITPAAGAAQPRTATHEG
ncbi:MAG: hypothetical protein IAE82_16310 [Opitutaceae bacterium]|nr:hypothetical protein [Opitutaceae bacterium]